MTRYRPLPGTLLVLALLSIWPLGCDVFVTADLKEGETNPACTNNNWDPGNYETDVDCGGSICLNRCTTNQKCTAPSDCISLNCVNGKCQVNGTSYPSHCSSNIQDTALGESDVDCGGSECAPCGLGKHCNTETDCEPALFCSNGFCAGSYPSHCFNAVKDDDETGVNCGGSCAPCSSSLPTHCSNNQLDTNMFESAIDCGGPYCNRCASGQPCITPADCASDYGCISGTCQNIGGGHPCWDGTQDYFETGVDCGGAMCPACSLNQQCQFHSDCQYQLFCQSGICATADPHCYNKGQDSDESQVDCGGNDCHPCWKDMSCSTDGDCLPWLTCHPTNKTCVPFYQAPTSTTTYNASPIGTINDLTLGKLGAEHRLVFAGTDSPPIVYVNDGSSMAWGQIQSLLNHNPGITPPGITQAQFCEQDNSWVLTQGVLTGDSVPSIFAWQYSGSTFVEKQFYTPAAANHLTGAFAATFAPTFGTADPVGLVTLEQVWNGASMYEGRLRYREMFMDSLSELETLGEFSTTTAGYQNGVSQLAFVPANQGLMVAARYCQNRSTVMPCEYDLSLNQLSVYMMTNTSPLTSYKCGYLNAGKVITAMAVAHTKPLVAVAYRDTTQSPTGQYLYGVALLDLSQLSSGCTQPVLSEIENGKKTTMTFTANEWIQDMAFSPSDDLVYVVLGGGGTSNRLSAVRIDASNRFIYLTDILYSAGGLTIPPAAVAVSPDHQWLVYAGQSTSTYEWMMVMYKRF